MRKILFTCIVMLVIQQNIFSQEDNKKWTIQINPLLLFSDIIVDRMDDALVIVALEGQYQLSDRSNISVTLSFLYENRSIEVYDDRSMNNRYYDDEYYLDKKTYYQIGIKPMYIHRPFETGLKGFYIGAYPNIGLRYSPIDKKNYFYTELGFGFDVGYKWIFKSGFTMQLGGGIGKTFSIPQRSYQDSYINSDGRITLSHSDISFMDFKLGYSF